jgi:hypothetical protein
MTTENGNPFDDGVLWEDSHGQAFDLGKLPEAIAAKLDAYPDQERLAKWRASHLPGVNLRPVQGIDGAWIILLVDDSTDEVFEVGELAREDLRA